MATIVVGYVPKPEGQAALRRSAEERFGSQRMVDDYLAVYEQAIALDRDRAARR